MKARLKFSKTADFKQVGTAVLRKRDYDNNR
jgi:hypothetical protein